MSAPRTLRILAEGEKGAQGKDSKNSKNLKKTTAPGKDKTVNDSPKDKVKAAAETEVFPDCGPVSAETLSEIDLDAPSNGKSKQHSETKDGIVTNTIVEPVKETQEKLATINEKIVEALSPVKVDSVKSDTSGKTYYNSSVCSPTNMSSESAPVSIQGQLKNQSEEATEEEAKDATKLNEQVSENLPSPDSETTDKTATTAEHSSGSTGDAFGEKTTVKLTKSKRRSAQQKRAKARKRAEEEAAAQAAQEAALAKAAEDAARAEEIAKKLTKIDDIRYQVVAQQVAQKKMELGLPVNSNSSGEKQSTPALGSSLQDDKLESASEATSKQPLSDSDPEDDSIGKRQKMRPSTTALIGSGTQQQESDNPFAAMSISTSSPGSKRGKKNSRRLAPPTKSQYSPLAIPDKQSDFTFEPSTDNSPFARRNSPLAKLESVGPQPFDFEPAADTPKFSWQIQDPVIKVPNVFGSPPSDLKDASSELCSSATSSDSEASKSDQLDESASNSDSSAASSTEDQVEWVLAEVPGRANSSATVGSQVVDEVSASEQQLPVDEPAQVEVPGCATTSATVGDGVEDQVIASEEQMLREEPTQVGAADEAIPSVKDQQLPETHVIDSLAVNTEAQDSKILVAEPTQTEAVDEAILSVNDEKLQENSSAITTEEQDSKVLVADCVVSATEDGTQCASDDKPEVATKEESADDVMAGCLRAIGALSETKKAMVDHPAENNENLLEKFSTLKPFLSTSRARPVSKQPAKVSVEKPTEQAQPMSLADIRQTIASAFASAKASGYTLEEILPQDVQDHFTTLTMLNDAGGDSAHEAPPSFPSTVTGFDTITHQWLEQQEANFSTAMRWLPLALLSFPSSVMGFDTTAHQWLGQQEVKFSSVMKWRTQASSNGKVFIAAMLPRFADAVVVEAEQEEVLKEAETFEKIEKLQPVHGTQVATEQQLVEMNNVVLHQDEDVSLELHEGDNLKPEDGSVVETDNGNAT
jgi:hypothetical protein